MAEVFIKAGSFIAIIVLGYLLKRAGFFKASDFSLVSKIVIYITLPCAVISNFSRLAMDYSLLMAIPFGIACNVILIGIGYGMAWKKSRVDRAFHMINCAGYNIGCFAMPYIQNFLGPSGIVCACLFDAGNSMMCTGGTYAMASAVAGNGEKASVKGIIKKIFSSAPFDSYVIMLTLSLLSITLPKPVLVFADTVGAANPFLAMLMIGIGFELKFEKEKTKQLIRILTVRTAVSFAFALGFYFLLPFQQEIRMVLALVSFAPISAVCGAFTEKCGGDVALSSAVNSLYIIVSLIAMTVLLLVLL